MKNVLILLAFIFSLFIVSCSEDPMSSAPVAPSLLKHEIGATDPADTFPYTRLTAFKQVTDIKFYTEGNSFKIALADVAETTLHFYVVIEYVTSGLYDEVYRSMLYLSRDDDNVLDIDGFSEVEINNVTVYSYDPLGPSQDLNYPFPNLDSFQNITGTSWEASKYDINIKNSAMTNSYPLFVELKGKNNSYLLYWGKSNSGSMIIPDYGKLGITDVHLFGKMIYFYDTVNLMN